MIIMSSLQHRSIYSSLHATLTYQAKHILITNIIISIIINPVKPSCSSSQRGSSPVVTPARAAAGGAHSSGHSVPSASSRESPCWINRDNVIINIIIILLIIIITIRLHPHHLTWTPGPYSSWRPSPSTSKDPNRRLPPHPWDMSCYWNHRSQARGEDWS